MDARYGLISSDKPGRVMPSDKSDQNFSNASADSSLLLYIMMDAFTARGSLCSYECSVHKTLHRNGVKFDIIGGTSTTSFAGLEPSHALIPVSCWWVDLALIISGY